jgi:hypothetical protein
MLNLTFVRPAMWVGNRSSSTCAHCALSVAFVSPACRNGKGRNGGKRGKHGKDGKAGKRGKEGVFFGEERPNPAGPSRPPV